MQTPLSRNSKTPMALLLDTGPRLELKHRNLVAIKARKAPVAAAAHDSPDLPRGETTRRAKSKTGMPGSCPHPVTNTNPPQPPFPPATQEQKQPHLFASMALDTAAQGLASQQLRGQCQDPGTSRRELEDSVSSTTTTENHEMGYYFGSGAFRAYAAPEFQGTLSFSGQDEGSSSSAASDEEDFSFLPQHIPVDADAKHELEPSVTGEDETEENNAVLVKKASLKKVSSARNATPDCKYKPLQERIRDDLDALQERKLVAPFVEDKVLIDEASSFSTIDPSDQVVNPNPMTEALISQETARASGCEPAKPQPTKNAAVDSKAEPTAAASSWWGVAISFVFGDKKEDAWRGGAHQEELSETLEMTSYSSDAFSLAHQADTSPHGGHEKVMVFSNIEYVSGNEAKSAPKATSDVVAYTPLQESIQRDLRSLRQMGLVAPFIEASVKEMEEKPTENLLDSSMDASYDLSLASTIVGSLDASGGSCSDSFSSDDEGEAMYFPSSWRGRASSFAPLGLTSQLECVPEDYESDETSLASFTDLVRGASKLEKVIPAASHHSYFSRSPSPSSSSEDSDFAGMDDHRSNSNSSEEKFRESAEAAHGASPQHSPRTRRRKLREIRDQKKLVLDSRLTAVVTSREESSSRSTAGSSDDEIRDGTPTLYIAEKALPGKAALQVVCQGHGDKQGGITAAAKDHSELPRKSSRLMSLRKKRESKKFNVDQCMSIVLERSREAEW